MPEPVPETLRSTAFDWKDLILFTVGFVVVVAGISAWAELSGDPGKLVTRIVLIAGIVGPLGARRLLFGSPALPEPYAGWHWSLLSMFGIFTALIGMGAAALGAWPLWSGEGAHLGVIFGGLGAVVVGAAMTAARYPRSPVPEARARLRQKE